MDLKDGGEYEVYREEVREFLKGWPLSGKEADLPLAEQEAIFRGRGIDAGFVYRSIPSEYGGAGGDADVLKDQIGSEEFNRRVMMR